jgi:uncharacterized protein (DUF1499 family)
MNLVATTIFLAGISSSAAFVAPQHATHVGSIGQLNAREGDAHDDDIAMTRRETLTKSLCVGAAAIGFMVSPDKAVAFDNRIPSKFDDRPRQRGTKPLKLGVAKRRDAAGGEYMGLRPCGTAPNCFCSTDDVDDSPYTNIPPFIPSKKMKSREDAFQQLYEVVKAYEPGQNDIDGGGFDIVTFDPKAGYIYVQFESLKNGYVDDFELATVGDDNAVQVRSSSRLGYLDFGVNAKRINYLAKALREKGWDAPGVPIETHSYYSGSNGYKW